MGLSPVPALDMALQTVIPPTDISAETLTRRLLNEGWKANGRRPLHLRKAALLGKLRSTGKLDYKRYLASPLRYAGGKSLAVGMVVELLPDNVQRVASPFMGGGSVEIALPERRWTSRNWPPTTISTRTPLMGRISSAGRPTFI